MKIKTAEAAGVVLDWLVAKCEGIKVVAWNTKDRAAYFVVLEEIYQDKDALTFYGDPEDTYYPSVNWAQGGPIIHRERLNFLDQGDSVAAYKSNGPYVGRRCLGETHLIAAMRCYVASKLGDEVEIPEELMK